MIYTNQSQVENVLQRELSTEEIAVLDSVIESVGKSINAYTGRNWLDIDADEYDLPEAQSRWFDGNGKKELFISDFMDIDSVELYDSVGDLTNTLTASDWIEYPLNTQWKNSLYLRNTIFPRNRASVKVTAVFYTGYVPSEVQLAAATLVGLVFSSSRNVGDFKSESIEGYSYQLLTGSEITGQEKSVLDRLDYWRKIEL
jgi:hypothetical protein